MCTQQRGKDAAQSQRMSVHPQAHQIWKDAVTLIFSFNNDREASEQLTISYGIGSSSLAKPLML